MFLKDNYSVDIQNSLIDDGIEERNKKIFDKVNESTDLCKKHNKLEN